MKKLLCSYSVLISSALLFSCVSPQQTQLVTDNAITCNNGVVRITSDFSTGRADTCEVRAENDYLITLKPENTPINSSPWYAFKLEAEKDVTVKITMKIDGSNHRYPPKVSVDGKTWHLQKYTMDGERMVMKINATTKPIIIAAQEIIDNDYYVDWAKGLEAKTKVKYDQLGKSTQNRPIFKLETRGNSNEWLVILGRQHPPEVTGALALFPFVETLLSTSDLANTFRKKYNILIIPNLNPDGVAAGNWRHNANGVDLNRDWNKFAQLETQQVNQYLKNLVASGQKIKFAIDFHSTNEDVFYTMPTDYGVENPYFVMHWLGALDKQMPNFNVVQKPGNNPDNGVSKQYFADNFGIHAITYEMGDNTGRSEIKRIAFNASNLLMSTMLSTVDHNQK